MASELTNDVTSANPESERRIGRSAKLFGNAPPAVRSPETSGWQVERDSRLGGLE